MLRTAGLALSDDGRGPMNIHRRLMEWLQDWISANEADRKFKPATRVDAEPLDAQTATRRELLANSERLARLT